MMDKILLAEDNNDTAKLVKEAFELENIDVDIASDGGVAYEMFSKNKYDLILLDLEMPVMRGDELVRKIRNDNPYIDVIIYTNYSNFEDVKKLLNLGVNAYINKGSEADLTELIEKVKNMLRPMSEEDIFTLLNDTERMKVE